VSSFGARHRGVLRATGGADTDDVDELLARYVAAYNNGDAGALAELGTGCARDLLRLVTR